MVVLYLAGFFGIHWMGVFEGLWGSFGDIWDVFGVRLGFFGDLLSSCGIPEGSWGFLAGSLRLFEDL